MTAAFDGALLPVCGADVLIVVVQPWVLADPFEAQLFVTAFGLRYQRTIVLVARDRRRVPTFFGPPAIARALAALPFEIIPWRRIPYHAPPRRPWMLPIPVDPPPVHGTSALVASQRGRTLVLGDQLEEDVS